MLNSEENRQAIFQAFPKLNEDELFEVTSSEDPCYNCIAWTGLRNNVWWWVTNASKPIVSLDGVTVDWPFGAIHTLQKEGLIDLFAKQGYVLQEDLNPDLEKGIRKIALYFNPNDEKFTHAARQKKDGLWTSKLGPSFDIQHGTPFTIEGEAYGQVYAIMKKNID